MSQGKNFPQRLIPLLLLFAWVTVFFCYLGWKPSFAYNAHRYFEILLLGCLFCAGVILPVKFRWGLFWSNLCLLLLLIMILVVWHADNQWLATREALQYVALFSAILVVSKVRSYIDKVVFDRAAIIGLTLFCFGGSLIVLEGLLVSLSIQRLDHRLIFGAFVNVRIFAELQLLTLLLFPGFWLLMDSTGWRRFIGLTAMLWWGLLLLTGTRSALVSLPFALLLLGLVGGGQALSWFKILARQFVGGLVVFVFLKAGVALYLGASFGDGYGSMSFVRATTSGRLDLWREAWSGFLQHPWVGNGPGSFACLTDSVAATPHNLFFQLLSEWGILMTVLCFGLALLMFISLVRSVRTDGHQDPLKYSLFATLVTVVATSMMQGMIVAPLQQMLIVLIFGLSLHVFASEKFITVTWGDFRWHQIGYSGVLIAVLVVSLWGVKSDLALQKELLVSPDGVINLSYGPRFWADGHDHCPSWHLSHQNL